MNELQLAADALPELRRRRFGRDLLRERQQSAPPMRHRRGGRFAREPPGQPGLWQSLRFWHRLSLATGVLLAAACVAIVVLVVRRPAVPPIPYMASMITEAGGNPAAAAAAMLFSPTDFTQG
ncbi:MAG: hypothetical protein HIU85_04840 [Proteobacteria bacterium]|nr:hypothetical protein [Pseudomonadota bacterium]